MARLIFTQQLARFTEAPDIQTCAPTLMQAFQEAFALNPRLRGYILDDQAHLRKHVTVFIDSDRVRDRTRLDLALSPDSTVYVLQALSGG